MVMKCIPCTTSRANCLECNIPGIILGYKDPMVKMACPECGITWRTITSFCVECKKPSKTPHYVDCQYCKGKKKGGEKLEQSNHSRSSNERSRSPIHPNRQGSSFF